MRYILRKIEPSAIAAAISADTAATADDMFAASAATVTSELIGVVFVTASWNTLRPLWTNWLDLLGIGSVGLLQPQYDSKPRCPIVSSIPRIKEQKRAIILRHTQADDVK